jgi:hypothetical protein
MLSEGVSQEAMHEQQGSVYVPPQGCCASPHLTWTPACLVEPLITCTQCGFRIDPDGLLLDWLDPEEIQAVQIIEENTPRILELGARLGLIENGTEQPGETGKAM